jgi:hypothetical protein
LGLVLALAAPPAWAQDVPDAKAQDAVDLFGSLCVQIETGLQTPLADGRYGIARVEPGVAAAAIPSLGDAPLWSIGARASGVKMLHYVTQSGICGVEVAEADSVAIARDFSVMVRDLAARLMSDQGPPKEETDEGGFITRIWRLHAPTGDIDVGISTSAPPASEPQHIMTMARVRSPAAPAAQTPGGSQGEEPAKAEQ